MTDVLANPPIFLHCSFRSGSTWLWNRFRQTEGTHAYYEPLHEAKALLTPELVAADGFDAWNSGHPPLTAPYNVEYLGLLRPEGGVPDYHQRFAYEDYYATEDGGLVRYIESLAGHARSLGKLPVFGFTRSLGRVRLLKAGCPGVHVVAVRNPWDQWASILAQAAHGNDYFALCYYAIAVFGRHRSPYGRFFDGLVLPEPVGRGLGRRWDFFRPFFRDTPAAMRFRIFLRVFLLDALLSLPQADVVVDLDRMSGDPAYRREQETLLRQMTGLAGLSFADCRLPGHPPDGDPAHRSALADALALLERDPSAPAALRSSVRVAVDRWPDGPPVPPPPEAPPPLSPLCVRLVLVALRMVTEDGRTERAMAFLEGALAGNFAANREGLADIAQFAIWQAPPDRPADKASAERLRRALLAERSGGEAGAGLPSAGANPAKPPAAQ